MLRDCPAAHAANRPLVHHTVLRAKLQAPRLRCRRRLQRDVLPATLPPGMPLAGPPHAFAQLGGTAATAKVREGWGPGSRDASAPPCAWSCKSIQGPNVHLPHATTRHCNMPHSPTGTCSTGSAGYVEVQIMIALCAALFAIEAVVSRDATRYCYTPPPLPPTHQAL